jgi:DNA (cytosine-5)-methyltransferase 1
MNILNLYCGIGGNRKLWGDEHDVTAVEFNPEIAEKYKKLYPGDNVVTGDAHEYLLENYKEFDFIWSSPPCQSHSRTNYFLNAQGVVRYPDMKLYQEILLLQNFFNGKFCIENVIGYYAPLIPPIKIGRHYLWSNFVIPNIEQPKDDIGKMCGKNQTASKKPLEERNAVNNELGLHILNCANNIYKSNNEKQIGLFTDED